jgi:DNA processing protein
MNSELLYQVSLSLVPTIGSVQAKILISHFGDAASVFKAKRTQLQHIEGIGETRARNLLRFNKFAEAEAEIRFIEKTSIRPLFITDPAYPQRLLHCYDSPTLLYYKGNADLNLSKVVAIIGTRNNTAYGQQLIEQLVSDLASRQVLIVSGLAYGIDAIAHKAAIQQYLPTVGVLAHGLDQLYPPQHVGLAAEMLLHGGLLTEFRSGTNPDKHNFPNRNRIVAGMCDATIVVETGIKGGSMITAELANDYNRDVFAFPGKTTDRKSEGCNTLIRNNKAVLLSDTQQLVELMGWDENTARPRRVQRELFIDLSEEEKVLVDILKEKETSHIDEINLRSGLSTSAVAAAILNLELQNVIVAMPGKRYMLQ